jgi:hypothetical protein
MPNELFTFRDANCVLYTVTDSIDSEQYFLFVENTSENPPSLVTRYSVSIETVSVDSPYKSIDTDMVLYSLKNTVVTHDSYKIFTVDSYSVSHSAEKTILTLHGEVVYQEDSLPTTIVLRLE